MKLTNIGGFDTLHDYAKSKLERYESSPKTYETLFGLMFSEKQNIFAESSDGYRIKKITFDECRKKIQRVAGAFREALCDVPQGATVGLYMANRVEWIQSFWAILMCGYSPLFMNARLPKQTLEQVLTEYKVAAVISDGEAFGVPTHSVDALFEKEDLPSPEITSWGKEIFFMSSGTTGEVKLCAYTAENFYYQLCDSMHIINVCPQIKEHYEGELKILALLPLYHVFGFIAVYLWFSFFSRTLVFPKDLNPQTIQNTIKKHKVTHIFAVPMVWETVYKKTLQTIRNRGEATFSKFKRGLALVGKAGKLQRPLSKMLFREVREGLFGESVRFLISGGSAISADTLAFFNGIGYHLANGYGMTEIGITSVDIAPDAKTRNRGSIGHPFQCTEYAVAENGELLVRGKTMATRILHGGKEHVTDFSAWFHTNDIVAKEGTRYFHQGRRDDLVVCRNGENLNPELLEKKLAVPHVKSQCLFADPNGDPVLLCGIEYCFSTDKIEQIHKALLQKLRELHLHDEIKTVALTMDELLPAGEFKISRKKLAEKYARGGFRLIDLQDPQEDMQKSLGLLEKKVCQVFADVLQKNVDEIGANADFFTDLDGNSLDYFVLLDSLKDKFNVDTALAREQGISNVNGFCDLIKKQSSAQ